MHFFPRHNFVKSTFAGTFKKMTKLYTHSTFTSKHAFYIVCVCTKASWGCRSPKMMLIQGRSRQEENDLLRTVLFLTYNIKNRYCSQYLANNGIFGEDELIFYGKHDT